MIRLHYSNRLEELVAPLAAAVAQQQKTRPLDPVVIVVPSRVIEQFVRMRLAETLGVAANLKFPFLRRFLAGVVEEADPAVKILELEEIQLALFESIRATLNNDGATRSPVRAYAGANGATQGARELRSFNLARRLAWLFREYSITRRPMVAGWHKGLLATTADAEQWQRDLWLSILDERGRLRSRWSIDGECQLMLLPDAFENVAADALKRALQVPLHVFGLGYAGPAYARMFSRIGEMTALNIYALNPCLEFWEDVDNPTGIARDAWIHRRHRIGAALDTSPDPFNLDIVGDTPALRLWGRPGREYIRLLNELTECDFDPHFVNPRDKHATLLSRVQKDVLFRQPERAACNEGDSMPDDRSIRILACPGVRRECEIVANEIWSLIRDDNEPNRLRFHQIGVLVPDRLYDSYLPHLETVFERLHEIPVNLLNRRYASESRVSEAVMLLLRLPLGRFSREEMLHLLTHPAITGEQTEIDTARVREWCDELGVFFGGGADDISATYIPPGIYHWDQALKRLALGVFMDSHEAQAFFSAPDGIDYLPYPTPQDETPAVAAFMRTARSLLFDGTEIRSKTLTLADWARMLSALILTYIRTSSPLDERVRDMCVASVESIATADIRSEPVAYEVAFEIASAAIADVQSQQGQFNGRGVVIGPISALRAIPLRAAFLMGLNEGDFPERTRRDPIDLRLTQRKVGDVTPTERDRYLFLETLGAAAERFYLSYVARDAQTGERLEPSSVIRELQFILRGYLDAAAIKRLTIEHPVSRYDSRYFPDLAQIPAEEHRELKSFDTEARHGVRMAALRANLAAHCGQVALPGRDEPLIELFDASARAKLHAPLRLIDLPASASAAAPDEISLPLSALRKFLECPLQGAAQYALGIFEEQDEAEDSCEDEPIAQSVLDRSILLREVFWAARGDAESLLREYEDAVRIARVCGRAPAGPFADTARNADLQRLRDWIQQARNVSAVADLGKWQDVRLGRADEFSRADRIAKEISLQIPNPSRASSRPLTVRLYGNAGFLSRKLDASIRCVLRKEPRPKDFLGGFLTAFALAASGEPCPSRFHAVVLCSANDKDQSNVRSLAMPTRTQAEAYLTMLLTDMLCQSNHYFLPIEAVSTILTRRRKDRDVNAVDIIADLREDGYFHCSSDYGPIRDARRFAPPGEKQLLQLINRRFVPIDAIFDE